MTTTSFSSNRHLRNMEPIAHLDRNSPHAERLVAPPVVNVEESDEEYIVYVMQSGMKREHLGVLVHNESLTISGGKPEHLRKLADRCEYEYSAWSRTYRLPANAETVMTTAVFRNGELVLHIPKVDDTIRFEPLVIHVY